MMKSSAILERARNLLTTDGWCQRINYLDGKRCSWGAIGASTTGSLDRVSYYLKTAAGARYISEWNDQKGRTVGQVLSAFDKAIELAKQDND